jgi:hypothetical protein
MMAAALANPGNNGTAFLFVLMVPSASFRASSPRWRHLI